MIKPLIVPDIKEMTITIVFGKGTITLSLITVLGQTLYREWLDGRVRPANNRYSVKGVR